MAGTGMLAVIFWRVASNAVTVPRKKVFEGPVKPTEIWEGLAGAAHEVFLRAMTTPVAVVPDWAAPGETLEIRGAGEMVKGDAVLLVKATPPMEPEMLMDVFAIAEAVASDDGRVKMTLRAVVAVVVARLGVTVVAAKVTGLPLPDGGVMVTLTPVAMPAKPVVLSWTV